MPKKILIVEDDKDSRFLLLCQLLSMNYEVIEADTAEQAIKQALGEKPDFIIMDLAMPEISCIQCAKMLKQNPATAQIPLVAYTAW